MHSFSTTIFKEGMNYLIEVPQPAAIIPVQKGNIPVRGYADGYAFKGTCVPRKENRYVLFLNSEIRNKINKTENERVYFEIEFDPESRDLPVPEDLEMILSEENGLYEKFMKFTLAHRRELIAYVHTAKRPETRLKYINRIVEHTRNYKVK